MHRISTLPFLLAAIAAGCQGPADVPLATDAAVAPGPDAMVDDAAQPDEDREARDASVGAPEDASRVPADGGPPEPDAGGAPCDFEVIRVPAGTTRRFSVGAGDRLENKIIDISARGAQYRINASGNGWVIRNIGIRGRFQTSEKLSPIIVSTNGGDGLVENVYLGDGGGGGSTGIFVLRSHSGTVTIRNVNVQGWPDNGIYASAPGNSTEHSAPGSGGVVQIENAFGADNGVSSFRIGTTGSYCRNCVNVGGDRGFWGYYEETRFIECDSSGAGEQFRAGANAWEKGRRAIIHLVDSRASGRINTGPGTVIGTPASDPRTSPPDGVPLSAEQAACGS